MLSILACLQLGSVALPLHPMIPQMITLYVASTMPQQHNVRSANPQLDEDRIAQHFRDKDTEDNFASQLVFLFYVLSHQEAVHSDPGRSSQSEHQGDSIICKNMSRQLKMGFCLNMIFMY